MIAVAVHKFYNHTTEKEIHSGNKQQDELTFGTFRQLISQHNLYIYFIALFLNKQFLFFHFCHSCFDELTSVSRSSTRTGCRRSSKLAAGRRQPTPSTVRPVAAVAPAPPPDFPASSGAPRRPSQPPSCVGCWVSKLCLRRDPLVRWWLVG